VYSREDERQMSRMGFAAIMIAGALSLQGQPAPRPAFEVASVKANASGSGGTMLNPNHGDLIADNVSLRQLVSFAFEIPDVQISAPSWMADQRFDIHAKRPAGAPEGDWRAMLQTLLEDRFHLKSHHESKEATVYNLVVASGGLKALALDASGATPPIKSSPSTPSMMMTNGTLSQFAGSLSRILGRPVVDRTGIEGKFRLVLAYDARPDPEGPDVYEALRNDLGLKLESAKGAVDVLVVDGADRTPTEN
jgi:bla regulator protein blaR1